MSKNLFWLLCLQLFSHRLLTPLFWANLNHFCLVVTLKNNPAGKSGLLIISWFSCQLQPQCLSVQKESEKGRFPSLTLVWTMWRQAGRHAMVVDLAHPDCGLLSLSVVRPLSEQSRHREEGEHRGGGGLWSTAVTLLHIIWESGGKKERDR